MITLTFKKEEKLVLGIKTEQGILDVEAVVSKFPELRDFPTTVKDLIAKGEKGKNELLSLGKIAKGDCSLYVEEDRLEFGPCIPNPGKIMCIGLNYRKHADETKMAYPTVPVLFSKYSNALAAHAEEILIPATSNQVDYEAELAIVIGKTAKDVKQEEALSYIYGYCIANDLSARDLQFQSSQWLMGKTSDGFCPIGPYLVSADEISDPNSLHIQLQVNGEIRQNSNTNDMIFNCAEIVSFLSAHLTLLPGDIILTGTPEGVIMGYPEDKRIWLRSGDNISIEIDKLGRLHNRMK
jgi:2-keto-4-pentenoate hydratase/2-oxohepta-3-ene-1,7-dioic acid hydratase in catechol pathway